jgi:hypothetical protein
MKKSLLGVPVLAALIGISGCATRAESVGTFGGAALGAGLGGGTMGTVGGAMVGYAAGRAYDEHHR